MKVILFCLLSFGAMAQKADTIQLTKLQLEKLEAYEKQIQELTQKRNELLEFIFDTHKVDVNKLKGLKMENGKLIYIESK